MSDRDIPKEVVSDEPSQVILPTVIVTIMPDGAVHVRSAGDIAIDQLFVIAGYLTRIANQNLDALEKTTPGKRRGLVVPFGRNGGRGN